MGMRILENASAGRPVGQSTILHRPGGGLYSKKSAIRGTNDNKRATYLSSSLRVVGVAGLLAPRAFDRLSINVSVVHGNDGVSGRFLGREPGCVE
jgi:hypothetical protein